MPESVDDFLTSTPPAGADLVERYRVLSDDIAAPIAVVATRRGRQPHAITVDSFLDVSYDPPTMAVSVYSGSRMMETLEECSHFTISLLTREQQHIAEWLGATGQPLYGLLDNIPLIDTPVHGQPVIAECLAWFELAHVDTVLVATHELVVGQVTDTGACRPEATPLLRYRKRYGTAHS